MRGVKFGLIVLAAALLALGLGGLAYAFHSGGVAECEGCHSMHSPKAGGSFLLVGTDQSSTCLTCHEHAGDTGPSSYHISTAPVDMPAGVPPKQRTPGGDFGWLKKSYTTGSGSSAYSEDGATHGHNIIALDFGYDVDPKNATAPGGGTFKSANLACTSCHDPHGQTRRLQNGNLVTTGQPIKASGSYNGSGNEPTVNEAVGVYRLLGGPGYTKGGVTFLGVPAAKAPSTYNQAETEPVKQVRVAYGSSTAVGQIKWGDWCATCHPNMHSATAGGTYVHPVDSALGSTVAANYNSYVKSGDLTGAAASSFSSLVPFATPGTYADLAALASNAPSAGTTLAGPTSTAQVTCLSCHRAHASGNMHALRFDNGYEFMTVDSKYLGSDNTSMTGSRTPLQHRGRLMAEWQATYYDRPATQFASWQRVLCNKCHAKD